uniref:Uncharacterized protein n=1 Tax=Vitis vinifera TaxID=29760 RepID=A5APW2_VITVI|nr:hypothetical protein VITISV_020408 [Vitis vinifera]
MEYECYHPPTKENVTMGIIFVENQAYFRDTYLHGESKPGEDRWWESSQPLPIPSVVYSLMLSTSTGPGSNSITSIHSGTGTGTGTGPGYNSTTLGSNFGTTNFDWPLQQFDVENAFLHRDLEKEVYIDILLGYEKESWTNKRSKKQLVVAHSSVEAEFRGMTQVKKEDYEDAARLKVAIAAAATNDTVGRVMSLLNRAIAEERYDDAAFIRDSAGAGLVIAGFHIGCLDDCMESGDSFAAIYVVLLWVVAYYKLVLMLRVEESRLLEAFNVVFGQIFGLKVNPDKSILFDINIDQAQLTRLALLLDCKAFDWPIPYLGLPLGRNLKACVFWNPMIEIISRRLDGWKKVGWWAGISDDNNDPYGRIVRISAEHGRYVARSYSPRQLATATVGAPLFEIFLTTNKRGEYRQQAVYLKRGGLSQDLSTMSSKSSGSTSNLNPLDLAEGKSDLLATSIEDSEDEDRDGDSDAAEGLSGFRNILRDMIPGVKVKVLKVTAPGKVDRDLISKVIEQIMEEEEDEQDIELESVETEEEVKVESDQEQDEIEMEAGHGIIDREEQNEIAVKVFVGGLVQKLSAGVPSKKLLRVPARLEKKGRMSFSFSIERDDNRKDNGGKGQASLDKKAKLRGQRSIDHVMFDLAKFIGREKIPMKVLKDVGELINLTLSQAHNRQPLSGSTTFNRIEIPASPDPLNGLYIGSHGLYTSEIIHLRRKFGQWKEDAGAKEPSNLEFYEYVEALKLTGDPYVPAGQRFLGNLYRCLSVPFSNQPCFGPLYGSINLVFDVLDIGACVGIVDLFHREYTLKSDASGFEEFGLLSRLQELKLYSISMDKLSG